MSQVDPPLPWQRLGRGYHHDDSLVLARAEHGYLAEILFVRWLAHGKAIAAPEGQEGEIIAGVLGFEQVDAPQLVAILRWFVEAGTVTATRKPGPKAKGTRNNCSYDLRNRAKYLPANRFLTRSQRTPNSEKPQVDAPPSRDDARDDGGDASVTTGVATDVRTDGRKPLAAKPPREVIFDALRSVCGWSGELTKSARGSLNNGVKQILDAGGTVEDVIIRAGRYRKEHPEWDLTPSALVKWWATLDGDDSGGDPSQEKTWAQAIERLRPEYGDRTRALLDLMRERFPSIPLETIVSFAPRFAKELDQKDDR